MSRTSKDDNEFLLEHWKLLVEQLMDVNKSLRDLVAAQQATILRLQGIQTSPSITINSETPKEMVT